MDVRIDENFHGGRPTHDPFLQLPVRMTTVPSRTPEQMVRTEIYSEICGGCGDVYHK